jgi:hypothetical protein
MSFWPRSVFHRFVCIITLPNQGHCKSDIIHVLRKARHHNIYPISYQFHPGITRPPQLFQSIMQ